MGEIGCSDRIPRRSVEPLERATPTRPDVALREYDGDEIAAFLRLDELDEAAKVIAGRINRALSPGCS